MSITPIHHVDARPVLSAIEQELLPGEYRPFWKRTMQEASKQKQILATGDHMITAFQWVQARRGGIVQDMFNGFYMLIEHKSPGIKVLHKTPSHAEALHALERSNRYAPGFLHKILRVPAIPKETGNLAIFQLEWATQAVLYHGDDLYQSNPSFMPDMLRTIGASLTGTRNLFIICPITKNTCKALRIKPTWKAMRAFVQATATV